MYFDATFKARSPRRDK